MRHIKKLATRIGNKGTQVTTTEILKKGSPKITIQKTVVVTERIESPTPLINILTRTSNRPNGFKRCRESIENQTYKNIRHIVSIDNLNDEEYVKNHNVDYFFMDKEAISKENDIPDPKTGTRFIYNLYLNHLINEVKEGWVLFLDDDDYLADNNTVQKMVNAIKNTTDLILWQMKYPNGQVLPSIQELGTPPRLARIGAPCFMLHSGIAKTIRWDGWKCGDFRFIQKAYAKTGEKRVIREVLISLGGAGLGMKKDISTVQSNLMGNNVYNNNEHGSAIDIFKKKVFKQKEENKLNELNKLKSFTNLNKQFIILSVGWNVETYLQDTYKSLTTQNIKDWKWFILDDNSSDNSFKIIQNIAKEDSRVQIFKNDKKMGAAYSRFFLLNEIKETEIDPIIILLDSDDMLSIETLEYLNLIYNDSNIKMTFGSHTYLSGKKHPIHFYNKEYFKNKKIPKDEKFGLPHLRTFKKSISTNLTFDDFKDEKGNYYNYCTDVILLLLLVKKLEPENIKYIDKNLYIYRDNRSNNTLSLFKHKKEILKKEIIKKIYG